MSKHTALPTRLRRALKKLNHGQKREALECLGVAERSVDDYYVSAVHLLAGAGRGSRESLTDTQQIPAVTA